MRQPAQDGEVTVAYLDEAGFAQVHPNRSAWTPVGEQHAIPAVRGQRLNVIAAFLSTGRVISAALGCALHALLFVGFLGLLRQQVGKPVTIILRCPAPCDYIPRRSYPLFLARDVLRTLREEVKRTRHATPKTRSLSDLECSRVPTRNLSRLSSARAAILA